MERKKLYFIYNPNAGKGKIVAKLSSVVEIFAKHGYEITIRPTFHAGEATELVAGQVVKYDLVVCSGGDGTLDETINGLMNCENPPELGYIPAGSTNDFAITLGIPREPEAAAEMIMQRNTFACDMGTFNGKYFVYVAAFGIFTDVSYQTDQTLKNRIGHAAYILEGLRKLKSIRTYRMRVEYDGNVVEGEYLLGLVCNTTSVGGFQNLLEMDVVLDDGLFEVVLISKPQLASDIQTLLQEISDGENLLEKYVQIFKASRLKITAMQETPWTLDGEYGGAPDVIEIQNVNQAVKIMVPEKHEGKTI